MVAAAFTLPALAAPHARALALLLDGAGEAELVRGAEADATLAACMLRAVRAQPGCADAALTAAAATAQLGATVTGRLLAGAAVADAFAGAHAAGLESDELWRHVLATALVAEAAAPDAERALHFAAGLLHDLGRLALAADDPRRYARVVVLARAGFDPREVERDLFATDHAVVGAAIVEAWGLPETLAAAVAGHHDGDGGALGDAVWQARHVATLLGLGDGVLLAGEAGAGARGGAPALLQTVEWYRAAITGRA